MERKIFLKVPGETVHLALIRKVIAEIAGKVGFPEEEVAKIEMAVDEACTNVIEHSYGAEDEAEAGYEWRREDEVDRPVELRVKINREKISITLADRGRGFDPSQVEPDLEKYLASVSMGGLGIYVLKTFMDEVRYSHEPAVGNVLKMVKYFESKTTDGTEKKG